MNYRILMLLAGTLFLSACQLIPFRTGDESESAPEPEAVSEEEVSVGDPLSQALIHLQEGEADAAEVLLESLLASNPDHQLAQQLIEQIRQPPRALLGTEYTEITVQPGDTLSGIAAEHLGDGLMFYALARYNDIERPRLLTPGRRLKIPVLAEPVAETETEPEAAPETPTAEELTRITDPVMEDDDSRLLARSIRQMVGNGHYDQAYELLLTMPHPEDLDAVATDTLREHYHERALDAWRDQRVEAAAGYWRKVLRIQPDFEPARLYLDRAESVLEKLDEMEKSG